MDLSRIFTLWSIQEFSPCLPFIKFYSGLLQNCYNLEDSHTFTIWTISECSHSGQFQNFPIWDHSRIFMFWNKPDNFFLLLTIPDFSHYGQLHNFYILDHSRIVTFWSTQIFQIIGDSRIFIYFKILHALDFSQILTSLTMPEFSHFLPIQNFYIMDYSKTSTLYTIPEFVHSWPLQRCYIICNFIIFTC